MAPSDEDECRQMLYTAVQHRPSAVRYPRGGGNGTAPRAQMRARRSARARSCAAAGGIALLAFGQPARVAREVAETLDATVANMRFVKPLDVELVAELATSHDLIVTLEENAVIGGAGARGRRLVDGLATRPRVLRLACPTTSSTTATKHNCSPRSASTRPASPASHARPEPRSAPKG